MEASMGCRYEARDGINHITAADRIVRPANLIPPPLCSLQNKKKKVEARICSREQSMDRWDEEGEERDAQKKKKTS